MKYLIVVVAFLFSGALLFGGGAAEVEGPAVDPEAGSPATGAALPSDRTIDEETRALLEESRIRVFTERVDSIPFTLETPEGESISLEQFHGSALLLNFWATWCPPCREELPSMIRLQEELEGENFAMLAVSLREDPEVVATFLRENDFDLPAVIDPSGAVGMEYGVRGLPTSYVIDRNGRVIGMLVGAREWDDPEVIALFEHLGEN